MIPPRRRGECPSLIAPMPTGDGLLARITPTGATIPLAAMAGLCAAARRHGNGIIEVTSRGSIVQSQPCSRGARSDCDAQDQPQTMCFRVSRQDHASCPLSLGFRPSPHHTPAARARGRRATPAVSAARSGAGRATPTH